MFLYVGRGGNGPFITCVYFLWGGSVFWLCFLWDRAFYFVIFYTYVDCLCTVLVPSDEEGLTTSRLCVCKPACVFKPVL